MAEASTVRPGPAVLPPVRIRPLRPARGSRLDPGERRRRGSVRRQSGVTAADILAQVSITDVWQALGGGPLRHGRGRAFWRDGDGYHVSLSDPKGTWYDHSRGEGGGILDLISLARGCSRADAL